jgi:large subunit ribosomal protein L24
MKIRKDDQVQVLSGKDRGKQGKVHSVDPQKGRVVVSGVRMIKRHTKPGRVRTQSGIIEREAPIALSSVMLVCNKCNKPTRVAFRFVEGGQKVRACRRCGEIIDETK